MEIDKIRAPYKRTERLILVLIALATPTFGTVYLYHNSGNLQWNLPLLPDSILWLFTGLGVSGLVLQYLNFRKQLKATHAVHELEDKVRIYLKATSQRFYVLFVVVIISTAGLLFFQNPIFTLIFAVSLVFFSVAKPTPDRMTRLMKLKKEEQELIRLASRPD